MFIEIANGSLKTNIYATICRTDSLDANLGHSILVYVCHVYLFSCHVGFQRRRLGRVTLSTLPNLPLIIIERVAKQLDARAPHMNILLLLLHCNNRLCCYQSFVLCFTLSSIISTTTLISKELTDPNILRSRYNEHLLLLNVPALLATQGCSSVVGTMGMTSD